MGAKIAALLVTLTAGLAGGVAILFFMLVAMNGYSESDATWGLGIYILLALVASVSMGFVAFFVTGRLIKREFSSVIASLITIAIFSLVGFGLEIVSSLIGVGIAEFVRVKF
jgi:O-antigen/teichoic acid export membrane protein